MHVGTRSRHLGMVRWPHAEDLTQPSIHRECPDLQLCGMASKLVPLGGNILGYTQGAGAGKGGSRFNDSTGDGPPPQGWAQDRVSQRPEGRLRNNPFSGGKIAGAVCSCYGSTTVDEGGAGPGQRCEEAMRDGCFPWHLCGGVPFAQQAHFIAFFCPFCFMRP